MTDFYAKVTNDQIERINVTPKQARLGQINFPTDADDDDFRAIGYWPITGTRPTAGEWQRVTGPTYSVNTENQTVERNYTVTDYTLAERKAAMINILKQTFATKRDLGTTVNFGAGDVAIKTDPQARSDVVSLYEDLVEREADGEVDPTQTFATAEYVVVQNCTIAMAKALRDAVAAHWRSVWERDAELGASINAAANGAALDLIDIEAGSIDGSGSWFS